MPHDPRLAAAYENTDAYDLLLLEVGRFPELSTLALHWRIERERGGMPIVHAFDKKDGSAEAIYFLLEALLRLIKLKVEVSAVIITGDAEISTIMTASALQGALSAHMTLLLSVFDVHMNLHGVGLLPKN